MKCRILHESSGRMRVHLYKTYMTMEQADILQLCLNKTEGIRDARVDERTGNAVIRYLPGCRAQVIDALAKLDPDRKDIAAPEHSSRAIDRAYQDKMIFHVARRVASRYLLPLPVRTALSLIKAVPYLIRGLKSLAQGKIEVSVLDAASIVVSVARKEYDTAGSVMFLLKVGDIMEEWTHKKSVANLADTMSLNVDKVWVRTEGGQEILTGVDRVHSGDVIIVRTGNMVPLDGTVVSGEAMVNQSSFTGEALPVRKTEGMSIFAGTVIETGEIQIAVNNAAGDGRYDRIVKMIEDSEKLKSATEDKASHLADRLVPWTFAATGLTWLLTRNTARAASILMVDFCCALKLSMPVAVLSAMKEAGNHHITVKGGKFLENFSESTTIVFDKTGTLTKATPSVYGVVPFDGRDEAEMLRFAACLEEHFPHSVANAVVKEAANRGLLHEERHTKVEYVVAHGIASSINGKKARIGSYHFIFEDEGVQIPEGEQEKFDNLPDSYSHLYLAIDGRLSAVILIDDPLKSEAAKTVKKLHELGLNRVVMMTGDSERMARTVANRLGLDEYYSEVLPEDKAAFVRKEHEKGRKVIMIGDGVNDSPALSEADVGVAINSGAAIAREIADITISEDDLEGLVTLRKISDGLMERIRWNYRTIVTFNSFLIVMGAIGIFPAATTALLHNASTIAISLRSMTDLLPEKEEIMLPAVRRK